MQKRNCSPLANALVRPLQVVASLADTGAQVVIHKTLVNVATQLSMRIPLEPDRALVYVFVHDFVLATKTTQGRLENGHARDCVPAPFVALFFKLEKSSSN